MYKDIDGLMKKMGISALYAEGSPQNDATMYYLLRGAHISAYYVKRRGKRACVVHSPIEREVAIKTGHRLISTNHYDMRTIFGKYRDPLRARAVFINTIFKDLRVRGSVVFYGSRHMDSSYYLMRRLTRMNRRITVYRSVGRGVISYARETKDAAEVERIKRVRNGVIRAFNQMITSVRAMKVKKDFIMKDRKTYLRIADLRTMLIRTLFEQNLVNSGGMIVAQGRDAGVPHNAGRDGSVVKLGKPIVFDIFPQESDGGYYFDFTRTICFGYAPKHLHVIYQTVKEAQDYAFRLLSVGTGYRSMERAVCDFFEERGHPTFVSNPKTQRGYCHSLGHGLGLDIHESPSFNLLKNNRDTIKRGHVFTVEPGLYYPEKGFGVRLEDVVYISPRGQVQNLTRYPRRLVVEM
jgi:Xaa-Pro aminopeptidase